MRGLVKYAAGPGAMKLMEMPEPLLRPGHVIVEVAAAGICGTDLHIQSAEYPFNPPVIMGHEFSGTVVELAEDVTRTRVGQRVTCLPYFSTCGVCDFCRSGEYNLCSDRKSAGSGTHGAFARYVLMPERSVRPLPETVDFIAGAVSEPLACCVHGLLEKATIRPTDLVVVSGPGSIGLLASQVALACGATVLLVGTGIDEPRLALARDLGVQHTINLEAQPAADLVRDLSSGRGADVVVDCSGAAPAVRLGYQLIRKKGQYLQLGLFGHGIEVDPDLAVNKEVLALNSFASTPSSWDYTLRLLRDGRVKTRPLVTDTLPLERWEQGFDRFRNKQAIKVVLLPDS